MRHLPSSSPSPSWPPATPSPAPNLREALQQRYQRKLPTTSASPPHPANWLNPGYARALAFRGPVDWAFLYPPTDLTDPASAIAMSRARMGVALWTPRAFLPPLGMHLRLQHPPLSDAVPRPRHCQRLDKPVSCWPNDRLPQTGLAEQDCRGGHQRLA